MCNSKSIVFFLKLFLFISATHIGVQHHNHKVDEYSTSKFEIYNTHTVFVAKQFTDIDADNLRYIHRVSKTSCFFTVYIFGKN